MENAVIRFRAKGQNLSLVSGYNRFAGNTIGYIRIEIEPDDEWRDFDSVDALFQNEQGTVPAVLFYDSGIYACNAPAEMTAASSLVFLNLSGKNVVNNVLVERLTTYPVFAFAIDRSANATSYRETEVSANMYEQYIAAVGDQVEKITGLTVSAHEADEPEVIKTAVPGLPINLDFGLVRGETGEQGIPGEPGVQGEPGVPGERGDPFTYDDFTEEQLAALVGPQGPRGLTGSAAGFGTVSATVDNNEGEPSVTVATSGPSTAKNINFEFKNLKGEKGDPIDVQVDDISVVTDDVANIPMADIGYYNAGVVKLATAVESGDNYNAVQLKYKRLGSATSKNLASTALATTSKRGLMSKADKTKLDGITSGAEVNVQSDWNQTNTSADDYIKNKPSVPTKVSDLENDVPYVEESQLSSLLPTDTASGSIASITDGQSIVPVKSLKVTLEPIQDLHGYDKPWSAGNGKNKVDCADISAPSTANATYNVSLESASYVLSFDFVNAVRANLTTVAVINVIDADENNHYIVDTDVKRVSDNATMASAGTNINGRYYAKYTGSISKIVFYWRSNSYGTYTSGAIKNIMTEVGTTPTTYSPYSNICPISGRTECDTYVSLTTSETDATVYTTALGRTVYGGTLDVVTGELVVDRAMVAFDGTEDWEKSSSGNAYYLALNQSTFQYAMTTPQFNICDKYAFKGFATGSYSSFLSDGEYLLFDYSRGSDTREIAFKNESITSVADWKASLQSNPATAVYELATPQTYQLTPTEVDLLLGQNNLWTDCGSVEVTYKADIQGYIDKKLAELQALVLEQ